jgi:O-antigen ligase
MQAPSSPKPSFLMTDPGRLVLGAVIGFAVSGYITLAMQLPLRWTVAAVIGILLPCLAILSGDVKRFFAGFMIVTIPFAMTQKMIIYPVEGFHISNGIGFGHLDFILLFLLALWAIRSVAFPEERRSVSPFSGFNLVAWLYVGVSCLCVLPASDRMLSLFEIVKILRAILIFLWVSNNIRSVQEHKYLAFFILLGANLQSLIVILQSFGFVPAGIRGITMAELSVEAYFHGRLYSRPGGILQHSNLLSLYLGMSIPFAFSLLQRQKQNQWFRMYCWFAFATGVLALVLCFSRAGWGNIAVSTAAILILHFRRTESRPEVIRTVILLSVALLAVLVYLWTPIMDRLFHSHPEMLSQRWGMNRDALRMWLDHPFLGAGLNNYAHRLPDYLSEGVSLPVHNIYLLHWAEMGPLGLAAYLLVVISFFWRALRLTRVEDEFRSSIAIAMVGIMLGTWVDGVFSFGWKWWVTFYMFWAIAGWMVALERFRDKQAEEKGS